VTKKDTTTCLKCRSNGDSISGIIKKGMIKHMKVQNHTKHFWVHVVWKH